MKKRINLRSYKEIKLRRIIIVIIICVLFLTFSLLNSFGKNTTEKVLEIGKQKANKVVYDVITNNVNRYVLDSKLFNEIIILTQNQNGEILTVDFNLESAYLLLRNITKSIDDNIKINEEEEGIYFEVPLGFYFNSVWLSNLGPKIPLKLNFVGTILSNLKTKITNYGLNNAMVELYATIVIVEKIITPVTNDSIKTSYDVLLSSKLINGRVPTFYGTTYEKESQLFDISN